MLRHTNGAPKPRRAGRERDLGPEVIVVGSSTSHAHNPSEAVLSEMKTSLRGGAWKVVQQFGEINRQIRHLSDVCSEYIGSRRKLPQQPYRRPPKEASLIGKPVHQFPSAEDYVFFTLLTIVTRQIHDYIFEPFHPAASADENTRCFNEYQLKINTEPQIAAATWRSNTFHDLDSKHVDAKSRVLGAISDSIMKELVSALESLPPQDDHLPPKLTSLLRAVLDMAYEWNKVVQTEIVKYDLEPYFVQPLSLWDSDRMESFERVSHAIKPGSPIISPVSLGLLGSVALGRKRVSYVQQKALVLVEEWFQDRPDGQGRIASTLTSSRRVCPSGAALTSTQEIIEPRTNAASDATENGLPLSGSPATRPLSVDPAKTRPTGSQGYVHSWWIWLKDLIGM